MFQFLSPSSNFLKQSPLAAILGLLAFLIAVVLLWQSRARSSFPPLRMTAGAKDTGRHLVAEKLRDRALSSGIVLSIENTSGSVEAIKQVAAGKLDIALIQGDLDAASIQDNLETGNHARQVASLGFEPLHLLVKARYANRTIPGLRGLRINLSTRGSGTRITSRNVLDFAGLHDGNGYTDLDLNYEQLRQKVDQNAADSEMPDAIFGVSLLPFEVAQKYVEHGYRILPIPFTAAFALSGHAVQETVIPAYTYGVDPPVPAKNTPTVGTQLLLVARDTVAADEVKRLLEIATSPEFARSANLPPVNEKSIAGLPEMPLHPGTMAFLNRDRPLITGDVVQELESLRNFFFSLILALFFGWRWLLRRRAASFDKYLGEVTVLEREALDLERQLKLNLEALLNIRQRLSELKSEALERYSRGDLKGEEMMASFLAHVTDARNHLNALILHARNQTEGISYE